MVRKPFLISIILVLAFVVLTMPAFATTVISVGDIEAESTVAIPINVTDASDIGAMDIRLEYNPDVLRATGVTTGTVTSGALVINDNTLTIGEDFSDESDNQTILNYGALANYTDTAGVVNISIIGSKYDFNGTGSIAVVMFDVVGAADTTSLLTLSNVAVYNLSAPIANAIDPTKTDGYETISVGTDDGEFKSLGGGLTIVECYDADNSGDISKDETIAAITDYFDDKISKDDAIEVITAYFG